MSGLFAAIGCALLGLAVGAALQRWGDGERKLHGHKGATPLEAKIAASGVRPRTEQEIDEILARLDYRGSGRSDWSAVS